MGIMQTTSSKLKVIFFTFVILSTTVLCDNCSDYISLAPDFKCQDSAQTFISGLQDPFFIVTQKDSKTEFLLVAVRDLKMAKVFQTNLEQIADQNVSLKLQFSKEDDQKRVFIFEIPENLNIFTKLTEKSYFDQSRQIAMIGKQLLEVLSTNQSVIIMGDVNPRNIFLDTGNTPKFLFMSGTPEHQASVQELSFALGLVLYTISQKKEPFPGRIEVLDQEVQKTRFKFKEGTSADLVKLISACLGQSESSESFDSLHETFLEILKKPTLDALEQDQDFIPLGNEMVEPAIKLQPVSMAIAFIYATIFLMGSIFFCALKKPLEQQQRNQVNPMLNGLDHAERNLQIIQERRNAQGFEDPAPANMA